MKAVLFSRVSSKEQEDSGYSLPAQKKLLDEYASNKGFTIAKHFSISESASGRYQRKTFDEMLGYVNKNKIKVIVCEKVDRLTRNMKSAVVINDWINEDPEREVHFVKENCILNQHSKSNEKFIWNIKVSVAQYHIDNLSEEVKKGQKEKLEQGWYPGAPKVGYQSDTRDGKIIHVLDPHYAKMIRLMFESYASGNYSIQKLADELYEKGYRSRSGRTFSKSRIADFLNDPFYHGCIIWKGMEYKGNYDPIISEKLFDKVQYILHRGSSPKYSKHNYAFKGLIRCSECEKLVTWEKHKGIVYGACKHVKEAKIKKWIKEADIEKQLKKEFASLQIKNERLCDWIRRALKEGAKEQGEYHSDMAAELTRKQKQIQNRLDLLYDDRLDGKISEEFYERKFNQYKKEKEEIIKALGGHSNSVDKYQETAVSIFDIAQKSYQIYTKKKDKEKRELISLVFENLYVQGTELQAELSPAFKILREAVSFTNSSKVAQKSATSDKKFEHFKTTFLQTKNRALDPVRSTWHGR